MRELGMTMVGCAVIFGFFTLKIYPNLEYSGYGGGHSCTDECYEEYIRINGTLAEQMERKREIANADEFSSIRSLWAGCAACHGMEGQGMAVFPKLAGQSAEYITDRLRTYKNRGEVGSMSSTMWAQASRLSEQDIDMIGNFIEETMK